MLQANVSQPQLPAEASEGDDVPINRRVATVPFELYPLVGACCAFFVLVLYGPLGLSVALPVIVYVASLSTITLSVKLVLVLYPFPKLLGSVHFFMGAVATGGLLLHRKVVRGLSIPVPTLEEMFGMIIPISFALVLSIGANNAALIHNSASFTEILSSANCVVTIAVVTLLGMPLDASLIPPAVTVAIGCALASFGDLDFSLAGCVLCLMACLFRSIKVALQQRLLTGRTREKFDAISLLFWIAMPCCLTTLLSSFISEGLRPWTILENFDDAKLWNLKVAVLLSCANALVLNLAQLHVTKDLGAVGSQLAGQMKMVLVVLGGVALFNETLTWLEILGFSMSLLGVYWFSMADAAIRNRTPPSKGPGLRRDQGFVPQLRAQPPAVWRLKK